MLQGKLARNSLSVVVYWGMSIFPLFMKDSFECVIPLRLAFIDSDEKSAVNFVEIPLYMTSHFSVAAFQILSLFINFFVFHHFHYMSACGFLFLFYLEFVGLHVCRFMVFIILGNFSVIKSSKMFF